MLRPVRGTLVWRLYVLGFIQLVVLGGAMVGVGHLMGPPRPPYPPRHSGPPPDAPPGGLSPLTEPPGPPSPVGPLLTFLVSGLVIVGVGSFLTARWIVAPLETLSQAARALGSGDLRARTGLARPDEIGDVGRVFDEMADRLEKLVLTERELLANVSHELRTPLARIRVALDIASEADAGADRPPLAEIGVDLAEINSLIDDILTAARLEIVDGRAAAGLPLHAEEIAPTIICDRAAERFRGRHPERTLDVSIGAGLPVVEVDPVLFRRVIDNLLENADRYSPDPALPIALRAAAGTGGVVFEVADRGMGIAAEDLPRVFTPFFRGERSRSRGSGGVGLGLTLAKRIVEAHGGAIEVTSAPGAGTTVCVTLPLQRTMQAALRLSRLVSPPSQA